MSGGGSACDVSVILPAFNAAATIEAAIRSAQRQSLGSIEIVVVDDGSIDETPSIVTRLAAADARIRFMRLPQNLGAPSARNAAIAMAQGEYLAVLDGDDWMLPQRLDRLVRQARAFDLDLVCDNLLIFDHAEQRIVDRTRHGGGRARSMTPSMIFERDTIFSRHQIGYLKPMMRAAFLRRHDLHYDPAFKIGDDFQLLAELVLKGGRAMVLPDADYVYVHRISPSTRTAPPHSRAPRGLGDIRRGSALLMARYWRQMTRAERRALARRRQAAAVWTRLLDLQRAAKSGDFERLVAILRRRPTLPLVRLLAARNRLHNRLARYWTWLTGGAPA